ncbi:MAG: MFS transporter [Verrucomicrobiales bacterium]|nr:MFS transporter [Verrucomicrobiales bacterium]
MNIKQDGITDNAGRLLWAGFTAILAAGVGFGVRGGILANWASEFGFTGAQLGSIGAAGLLGFCPGIILGGLVVDKLGYGKLVFAAFLFHVLSAFVTFGAMGDQPQEVAFQFLFWGTFTFAVANGVLEAVSNPLVATLFPTKRTHYLNILHASWPLGLVFGGLIGWTMGGFDWKIQLALFLVPTLIYGIMFMGQKMPKSEASEKGLSFGEMLKDVGILGGLVVCLLIGMFVNFAGGIFTPDFPSWIGWVVCFALLVGISFLTKFSFGAFLLFVLFITHALVGAVELGTDGWIQNITGNILTAEQGKILFVFTSLIMFGLRFCADFIENKLGLSPIGLLFVCSILAIAGLFLASNISSFGLAFLALAVYALGKTFFWPTMLAVVGDRFPKSGAVAMSLMGGIGMLSAGLIGSVGLGFAKDKFSTEALEAADPSIYAQYKAVSEDGSDVRSKFLVLESGALDGKKMGAIKEKLEKGEELTAEEAAAQAASIEGDRKTLRADAFIPALMAVIYLLLFLYFKAKGGYRPLRIDEV